jgi:3-dehydroquinate dehydratase II
MKIAIINGPNLNLLGLREPEIYGSQGFDECYEVLCKRYPKVEFSVFQSNVEGELIDEIQRAGFECDGIVLNAGGYSHTSVAIADAVAAVAVPTIEVHISNIFKREEVRHTSLLSAAAAGVIVGLGLDVYRLAVEALIEKNR